MFLHHLLLNNEASIPQRFNGTWTMSKMTWGANKYAKLWANINEGIFFNVFCWLRCLSKWGVGPLKRGSHLSAQGQQSCSGQPHCASLIVKNLRRFGARIWSGWGNCRLSATVMTQSFLSMQCITTIMQYFTIMPMQYIGQLFILQYATYVPRCKSDRSDWSGRSHLARCREVVNNSVKGSNLTTSREYFHEIFSRLRIINSMPVLSPSNSMLWSYTDLLSV